MKYSLSYKIIEVTSVSHVLAAFRPVPQSCTSSTLLRHRTKISSRHATLPSTFIIKQALKGVEFDPILREAGSNAFTMSPSRWVELTGAIGIMNKLGRDGGTYAQRDIAFKFASWVSVEFELYLVKEFQRLKEVEQRQLGWSAKRELSKINYRIHTDAIKHNLIPAEVTKAQANIIYANEADVLNVAMFGMTAKQWRDANPSLKGNIRDYATINELICLSNMENLNAVFIEQGISQPERLL